MAKIEKAATHACEVSRLKQGVLSTESDQVAEEVPVALVYNGVSHAVMLATPQDLEDFALGFSLTEGVLQNKSELYDIEVLQQELGIELQVEIATERFAKLKEQRRSMAGRTGCGLCGAESLQQVFRLPEAQQLTSEKKSLQMQAIFRACASMRAMQTLQQVTGATHACLWADEQGEAAYVREDVGRHNALDKLIGALIKDGITGGFIITSSRASYEMVQKTIMAGFDVLVAVSAPTGLAVRMAKDYGVTLLGFVREQQAVTYSHGNRILE